MGTLVSSSETVPRADRPLPGRHDRPSHTGKDGTFMTAEILKDA